MLESSYINMEQYNRIQDQKIQASMSMARDNSFRNPFANNGMNNRGMPNNCGQYNDMGVLSQGMNRMNLNNMIGHNGSFSNGNKWSSNGYSSAMHNSNNMTNNNNINMMLNNTNPSMDMRSHFVSPISGSGNTGGYGRSISKQQFYSHNPTVLNWHADASSSMSPNGALNDLNQARLAKNLSCPGMPENIVGIIIRKVQPQHIELVKSICVDSGTMTNFQLQPQIQSIIVHFNSPLEARRCMSIIQNQLNVRVELINEDYMHFMTGAN